MDIEVFFRLCTDVKHLLCYTNGYITHTGKWKMNKIIWGKLVFNIVDWLTKLEQQFPK